MSIGHLKLLDALRAPDSEQFKEVAQTYNLSNAPCILEIAISSTPSVFTAVLQWYRQQHRDINEKNPDSGNTALHVAAYTNNLDSARLLLKEPTINDTATNNAGDTPVECAQTSEMTALMNDAQQKFLKDVSIGLKTAFNQRDLKTLDILFSNPRVDELIDINGVDPDTGNTVLHDAAQAGDLNLVQFILNHRGDPLARNSRKQAPVDVAKSPQVQSELTHAAKTHTVNNHSDTVQGFLKKWTNFTQGYRSRWFVLENGKLSYYKHPDDKQPRDVLVLSNATIKVQSSVSKSFEIKTRHHKLVLKAAHSNDANRWVWALQNAISDNQRPKATRPSNQSVTSGVSASAGSASVGAKAFGPTLNVPGNDDTSPPSSSSGHARQNSTAPSTRSTRFIDDLDNGFLLSEDEDDDDEPLVEPAPPAAVVASLDALASLCKENPNSSTPTALHTIDQLKTDISGYRQLYSRIIRRLKCQIEQSEQQQRFWAQNCRSLEVKLEKAEGLIYLKQKQESQGEDEIDDGDVFYDTVDEFERANLGHPNAHDPARGTHPNNASSDPTDSNKSATSNANFVSDSSEKGGAGPGSVAAGAAAGAVAAGGTAATVHHSTSETATHASEPTVAHKTSPLESHETPQQDKHQSQAGDEKHSHSHGDESNYEKLTSPQTDIEKVIVQEDSFAGYEGGVRKHLNLDKDNRPKISLWGVLKSLIGKDMTKMTLPVSFNECTNLLQRSAEDMEYVDLLDKAAATTEDDGLRMAFVAAFCASSYSSTINRVAKPFNPLLGETFEYCRPDHDFRMISEQVSHHPPIGALYAESPRWTFYGHSDVKSKFNGRSFDIVPTGLWYLALRPDKGSGVKEELYTFRKVTSSVVGIMVGSPLVDNYGTMEIRNHTTGVSCNFEFKSRGWRGNSAFKVEGVVKDKRGQELYTVGGKWDDKIYAKKAGADSKGKLLLWQVHERPNAPFNLTPFAITLNALPDELKTWLPPTDTRFRPDQRDMEEGRYDQAGQAKDRVEKKQRAARRQREEKGLSYEPSWFKLAKHPVTGEDYYAPANDYWAHRAKHDWNCPDIF